MQKNLYYKLRKIYDRKKIFFLINFKCIIFIFYNYILYVKMYNNLRKKMKTKIIPYKLIII